MKQVKQIRKRFSYNELLLDLGIGLSSRRSGGKKSNTDQRESDLDYGAAMPTPASLSVLMEQIEKYIADNPDGVTKQQVIHLFNVDRPGVIQSLRSLCRRNKIEIIAGRFYHL